MKASSYMYEAKNVSGVMGRHSEVKVVFGGDEASTNGSVITLPSVNEDHEMSEVDVNVARGYVDHEAAHVKWTDNKVWKKLMDDRMDDPNVGVFHSTLNALEDVRIEGKLLAQYSGSRDNLDAVADACGTELRDSLEGQSLADLSAREVGALAATWYGRGRHSYGRVGAEMFGEINPDVQKIVTQHVDQIDEHTSFEEVAKLADSMMACFDKHDEEEEEKDSKGGEKSKDGEGEEDTSEESEKSSEGEDGSGGAGEKKVERTEKREVMSDEEAKKEVLKKATGADDDVSRKEGYRRYSDAEDEVIGHDKLNKDGSRFKKVQTEMIGQINVIRRKLERKLASKVQRGWHGGQTKGRLDSRRLVGAYTGSESVYKSRDVGDDIDVAVVIAVDHSGSMDGGRILMAQKAVIALAEALEPTHVKLSVKGFKTKRVPRGWREAYKAMRDKRGCSSISPILIFDYKSFTQPLHRCREVIGGMKKSFDYIGGVHNVDGASINIIGAELLKRPEKRKILMVMSDGMPEDSEMDEGQMRSDLIDKVKSLEARGVEVFGIGIQTDAVKRFYRWHTVVRNTDDLEKELIDRMTNVLVGGGWDVRKAS
tara:strand:+ start:542 stop:2329 length:1788 start_codon:yes stop_codon:yes gene_type:complete